MSSILIEKALSVSLMAACDFNDIWLHDITAGRLPFTLALFATPNLLELSSGGISYSLSQK